MGYLIVYSFEGELKNKIKKLQLEISNKYGIYEALKFEPHFTLKYPFQTENIKDIELFLDNYVKKLESFKFKLDNFDCFGERVIFISLIQNDKITKIRNDIVENVCSLLNLKEEKRDLKEKFNITLAYKDLDQNSFLKIKDFLKNKSFNEEVLFDRITIIKKNRDKWKTYKHFDIK